jgi:hypothetical protein
VSVYLTPRAAGSVLDLLTTSPRRKAASSSLRLDVFC